MRNYKPWMLAGVVLTLSLLLVACAHGWGFINNDAHRSVV